MQIQLLIPGLLWPAVTSGSATAGLTLDGLARLIGHGQWRLTAPAPWPAALLAQCGAAAASAVGSPAAWPLAGWRRLGEDDSPPSALPVTRLLCADPVHLSFNRSHLLLHGLTEDELSLAEAQQFCEALNEVFADVGEFVAAAPLRWYLQLPQAPRADFHPLAEVIGRPVKHYLPEGEEGRHWQRLLNEAQVVLHNHPLNQRREAAGQRSINSLWLWGAAQQALPALRLPDARLLQADDCLSRGLLRSLGGAPIATDFARAAASEGSLVVLDGLQTPAHLLDLGSWRTVLQQLENDWFAPLAAAFAQRRLRRLEIIAPGDRATLQLELGARARWKFWRRPRAFDDVLRAAAPQAELAPGAAASQPQP